MSPHRLLAVARKEWIQLRRDRRSMILAFALPMMLLVFFGYAISFDIDDITLAVLDEDRSAASRELLDAFVASDYFTIDRHLDSAGEIDDLLVRGRVMGVLRIPSGYARDRASADRDASVQLLLDGADANTATIAMNLSGAVAAMHSARVSSLGGAPLRLESRTWYNPQLESRHMKIGRA